MTLIATESQPQAIATAIPGESRTDDPKDDLDRIQGNWIRISTNGNKNFDPKTVTMVVKKSSNQPKGGSSE